VVVEEFLCSREFSEQVLNIRPKGLFEESEASEGMAL